MIGGAQMGSKSKKSSSINHKVKREYIMFVDETDPTSTNDYFCLAGMIVERGEYEDILTKKINTLKKKHFKDTGIIFHYTEMKNNKGIFKKFQDTNVRNSFYVDFVHILKESNVTILSSYFNKQYMKQSYNKCAISDYDVAFKNLLENFVHFLQNNNGDGMVIIESRSFNQNSKLQNTFYHYLNNGSEFFLPSTIQGYLKCLGFIVKNENCVGLQLVDYVPATIIRILNHETDKYSMQEVVKNKIYYYGTDCQNILGVKNVLGTSN